jgi:hypothetical protein
MLISFMPGVHASRSLHETHAHTHTQTSTNLHKLYTHTTLPHRSKQAYIYSSRLAWTDRYHYGSIPQVELLCYM